MKTGSAPVVAIVGRPNTGKSTLLNRLISQREAVVDATPGVTRDRIYAECDWNGREFVLIDTGGISVVDDSEFASQIKEQVELAISEADVIMFVVDAKTGITAEDEHIAAMLQRTRKPVVVVANKVESSATEMSYHEFHALGLGEPIPVSALHGTGTGDLLDLIVSLLPESKELEKKEYEAAVTLVGRPNTGKSSLLNALLGEKRAIISEIPGTTRDAVDSVLQYDGRLYRLIDTAGILRKKHKQEPLFFYSFLRALRAIERSDVSLLVIDASEEVTRQDQKIAELIEEKGNACVILLNKWDLIKTEEQRGEIHDQLGRKLSFLGYAPVLHVSARTGRNIGKIIPAVDEVLAEYRKRIPTSELNRWMNELKAQGYTVVSGPKRLKVYYVTQYDVEPPSFVFFVNDRTMVRASYVKFLENRLRQSFGFKGTPLKIKFKNRER